jgi:hypothetical protein
VDELAQLRPDENPGNSDLLDYLPVGEIAPPAEPTEELHQLFQSLRLQVHYDHKTNRARCRVTLRTDSIDAVLTASAQIVRSCVDVVRAPCRMSADL